MDGILLRNIISDGKDCDIYIKGNVISDIAPAGAGRPDENCEAVDCRGKTALPGMINAHTHASMTLFRGVGEDICFQDWINKIWAEEEKIDDEFIYWAAKVACLEMIRTGTSAFLDQYWRVPAAAQAVREMGLRAVLSYVHLDHYDPATADRQRRECQEVYEESLSWPSTIGFSVAVHSVYSVSERQIVWAADFARAHGLKLNVHLCETEKEVRDCRAAHGMSPVAYLDSLGVLGPDVIAAHVLWLDEDDIRILAGRGVSCVHNINSNLKLASGYRFLYNELKEAGVNLCIGTDGCASSNNLDLLEAMKTAALVQNNKGIAVIAVGFFSQIVKHYLVQAELSGFTGIFQFNPVADVLAAGIVFTPQNFIADFLQNVEQVFGVSLRAGNKAFLPAGGKSAGDRDGG